MKHPLFILLYIFTLCSLYSCNTEEKEKQWIEKTIISFEKNLLTQKIDSIFSKNHFNGSISVMKNGQLLYKKHNGFQDFKAKTKLDHHSIFAIGSISKQFTAVLILLEVEKGSIQLNDKASQYLTALQNKTYQDITIHQLLNHSSGINDFGSTLLFKSGTDFNYSNKGYRFLGELLEQVTGKSYDTLAKELFAKAELRHTYTPSAFHQQNFASAYVGNVSHFSKVKNMPERLTKKNISLPAGGILSTVEDLHQWNIALHEGNILQSESLHLLTENSIERTHFLFGKVGYGYGIMCNLNAPESYFHTGYIKGSPSLLMYYPTTKTSVVILSNIANETKGKKHFFAAHQSLKNNVDIIENTVNTVREKMLKEVEK